ncbi:hypothetical protein BD626DRAFT_147368 [Schizophyllum amplum]|uniref:Uncharacterized protein n=1 Tax=Schizophyllum amplum TaxID=97359 RepID=A0A550C4G4_9AGAR|nr:hypothetical protein BD626DRAFT_147368 [Auriculariopsis ampla]
MLVVRYSTPMRPIRGGRCPYAQCSSPIRALLAASAYPKETVRAWQRERMTTARPQPRKMHFPGRAKCVPRIPLLFHFGIWARRLSWGLRYHRNRNLVAFGIRTLSPSESKPARRCEGSSTTRGHFDDGEDNSAMRGQFDDARADRRWERPARRCEASSTSEDSSTRRGLFGGRRASRRSEGSSAVRGLLGVARPARRCEARMTMQGQLDDAAAARPARLVRRCEASLAMTMRGQSDGCEKGNERGGTSHGRAGALRGRGGAFRAAGGTHFARPGGHTSRGRGDTHRAAGSKARLSTSSDQPPRRRPSFDVERSGSRCRRPGFPSRGTSTARLSTSSDQALYVERLGSRCRATRFSTSSDQVLHIEDQALDADD